MSVPSAENNPPLEPSSRELAKLDTDPEQSVSSTQSISACAESPQIIGRYEILKELGSGGMATVYMAKDPLLARNVALKLPRAFQKQDNAGIVQRFYREARAVARLAHPHICPVYDVGEADGRHYLAMHYIEGRSLEKLVGNGNRIEQRKAARIVYRIAQAMHHAHENGVVHRDLKSSNIMLDLGGVPFVLDFGLVQILDEGISAATLKGEVFGSPAYMSPEQVGGHPVDRRTDIFSLGVVFFECLSGFRPFTGTLSQVRTKITTGSTNPDLSSIPDIDSEVTQICKQMMATNQALRYQSMEMVVKALRAYLKTDTSVSGQHSAPQTRFRTAAPAATHISADDDVIQKPQGEKKESRAKSKENGERPPLSQEQFGIESESIWRIASTAMDQALVDRRKTEQTLADRRKSDVRPNWLNLSFRYPLMSIFLVAVLFLGLFAAIIDRSRSVVVLNQTEKGPQQSTAIPTNGASPRKTLEESTTRKKNSFSLVEIEDKSTPD